MISVVLADDHAIVRQGLRSLLESQDDYRVVGEAADGLAAISLIAELRPEVAIIDMQLPDLHGLEVARRTKEQSPTTRVVILSMHGDEPFVLDALRFGALGYVLKGSTTNDLIAAVEAALEGRRYLSPVLADRAFDAYARRAEDTARPLDRYELLTTREREVLQLTVQGMGNTEIGERLAISPRTAETHRANFLRKLGIQSHSDLIFFAICRGLIEPSKDHR